MAASVGEHRPTKTATWSNHCSWTGELQKVCEVPSVRTDVGYSRWKVAFPYICVEFWSTSVCDVFFNFWCLDCGMVSIDTCHDDLIVDPNVRPPGFDLRRHNCVLLNRFRTEQGRCTHLMHRWGLVESPPCDCSAEEQTMHHIVDYCPFQLFADGLTGLCVRWATRQWSTYLVLTSISNERGQL
jgi:hypothetical protein